MDPPARLFLWEDRFLWASRSFKGAMTRRYATNVIVAIADQPLRLKLPRKPARDCAAAICASGALRMVDATDTPFLSLNLDPETPHARLIEQRAQGGVVPIDRGLLADCDGDMQRMLDGKLDPAQARTLGDDIVTAITGAPNRSVAIDARVMQVAHELRESLPADIKADELAGRVGLSAARLMHLFTEQMGLPMSSFLLWAKMRSAIALMQTGLTLTDIAHRCGFADSSHLTRTFQSFYAVKPSVLLDSSYVQVRHC